VEEKEMAKEIWEEQCFQSPNRVLRKEGQPKGGEEVVSVLMQTMTDEAAYQDYKMRTLADGGIPLCKCTFVLQKPYNVRISPKQWGLCPHCALGPKLIVQLEDLVRKVHVGCGDSCHKNGRCITERNADAATKAQLHKLRVEVGHFQSHLTLRKIQVCVNV
jgi:hypothetical protein